MSQLGHDLVTPELIICLRQVKKWEQRPASLEDLEDEPQLGKRRAKAKVPQAMSASTSGSSVKPKQPLKIKLKLGGGGGGGAASSSNGTPVDGEEATPPSLPSVNLKLGSRGKVSSTSTSFPLFPSPFV